MRALIVASEFPPGPGGIGQQAWQLAQGLANCGWQIATLARQDYSSADQRRRFLDAAPFDFTRLPPEGGRLRRLRAWRRLLAQTVQQHAPEVIVASGRSAVHLVQPLAPTLPVVGVGHGTEFTHGSAWTRALTRRTYGRLDAMVCVSDFTRRAVNRAGIELDRTTVIHNGADDTRFGPQPADVRRRIRRRLGIDGPMLLTVGNVTRRKGQDIVVRALPTILESHPDSTYVVAGLATRGPSLQQLANDLGIADRVNLLGAVPDRDLPSLYAAADIFLLTSRNVRGDFEGFGIVVLEAALTGIPAVVSDSGGLAESVVDGVTGKLVPEGDAGALATAVSALLTEHEQRRKLGRAALDRARKMTWRHQIALYDHWLRQVVGDATAVPGERT